MESIFTAIFEKVDDWYIGYVEELAGAKQGKTLEEAQGESTRSYRIEKELWAMILSVRKSRLLSNEAAKIEKVFALVPK